MSKAPRQPSRRMTAAIRATTPPVQPMPPASGEVCVEITQEMIAKRSHEIWERKGRPTDMDTENWIEAEAELKAQTRR